MDIVLLEGSVNYKITLDPSVWIFDDRKIDLTDLFSHKQSETKEQDGYTKSFSQAWDREINEEAIQPPVKKSVKQFEKEKVLNGSFGIPLMPFLKNAEPTKDASKVVIETTTGKSHVLPVEQAKNGILGFSNNGVPLREDGPVHFYYGDGSNKDNPIRNIVKFIIK